MNTTTQHDIHSAELLALIDSLVEAIDADRLTEIDRVQTALQPFGGSLLFASEMRLNGRSSTDLWTVLDEEVAY